MHPAKEGFASLPFFDEFDLSTVDILLISQYVRSLLSFEFLCHADTMFLESLLGVLYTERTKSTFEQCHWKMIIPRVLFWTACISEKQYNIFSLSLLDICPPVRLIVNASCMAARCSQLADSSAYRNFQFCPLAEIANV